MSRQTGKASYNGFMAGLAWVLLALWATASVIAQDRHEDTKLTASDAAGGERFGFSVAIDGNTMVAGAYEDNSAYVYESNGVGWIQRAKLTASDAAAGDHFGVSVSVGGDTIAVGSYGAAGGAGAAYVFVKPGGGWSDMQETVKLTASDAAANDQFGESVSINEDMIAVTAPGDDCGAGNDCGSAYVFVKPGGGWCASPPCLPNAPLIETAKLTASDAAADAQFGGRLNDYGGTISISEDTIVVGAPLEGGGARGSAYVFVRPGGGWISSTETAKLTAPGQPASYAFGSGVSISGDTLVVGAPGDGNGGAVRGSAFVFVKPGGGWSPMPPTAELSASDASNEDYLGTSVSIDGDVIVAGTLAACGAGQGCGSAYVFVKPSGGWVNSTEAIKLTPLDLGEEDRFGNSVSISGRTVVVGAQYNDSGGSCVDCGAAYVFHLPPVFVDEDAAGLNNGTSWADAFNNLQDALSIALPGDEIWVAEGVYNPDQGVGITPGDRTASFSLLDGVAIYGGFAGTETSLDHRDIDANPTILSGDLNGNDIDFPCDENVDCASLGGLCMNGSCIIPQNNSENSLSVTTGSDTASTARLDGFTVTAGNADSSANGHNGGGMYNLSGSPTVINCTFHGNAVGVAGGASATGGAAMANDASSPNVINCTFTGNCAFFNGSEGGGGIWNTNGSSPRITRCNFSNNSASSGGGIYNEVSSNPIVTNCTFARNFANSDGGGISNANSSPTVINCTFSGNTANGGGAITTSGTNTGSITNCTFAGNTAEDLGGGIAGGSPTLANCILWGNSDSSGMTESAQIHIAGGTPIVNYSIVQGGWTGQGSNNLNFDPLFIDTDGADNIVGTIDDNLRLQPGSPAIDSGDSCTLPSDTLDLDGDGDTTERLPYDLDGFARMVGYAVDMGAYENQSVLGGDCNHNGFVDDFDICSGASMDVDADGIPDECTEFTGGCGGNGNWSCEQNWEDNVVPNNDVVTYSVILETPADAACLDIDVTIDSLLIADGASLDMSGQGGCDGDLTIVESGGLLLDGTLTDTGPCVAGGASARAGHTPPNLSIRGPGATTIVYSFDLEGIVDFELSAIEPLNLGGDFNNQCTSGLCVNMRDGMVLLTGDSPSGPEQRFEAAAADVGPVGTIEDADYAVGTLEIASGSEVTFSDTFDNDGNGQGACTEAVYVSTLRVGSPATIILDNVRVYYETLDPDPLDPGVTVNAIGCGALVPVTCPAVSAATRFDPTIDRNRYLSIMPGNAGQSVALRVSILSAPTVPSLAGQERWVGLPAAVNDPPNGGNIFVAPLQCDPLFMNWAAFPTINVYGPDIVPSTLSPTQYEVVVVPESCSAFSGAYSAPLLITQAKWGDVRDPYGGASQPNFADINAIVQKFSNLPTAPTLTRVDLVGTGNPGQPSTPNRTVSFADVSACVSAFGGFPYPYIGGSCP